MIDIWIPGEPPRATAQQKGFNRRTGRYYVKDTVRSAAARFDWYIAAAMREQGIEEEITEPVTVWIRFGFPTSKKSLRYQPKDTRPDVDNLSKQLIDELMACRLLKDDALIYHLDLMKFWVPAEEAGIKIQVQTRTEEEEML